jgi:hypothetical protein
MVNMTKYVLRSCLSSYPGIERGSHNAPLPDLRFESRGTEPLAASDLRVDRGRLRKVAAGSA